MYILTHSNHKILVKLLILLLLRFLILNDAHGQNMHALVSINQTLNDLKGLFVVSVL